MFIHKTTWMLKTTTPPCPQSKNAPDRTFNFAPPAPQPTYGNSMEALNHTQAFEYENSTEPSPLAVILYSANILANPNLWDGNFRSMFLFGTNEFLQSDVCNMACCYIMENNH